MREFTTVTWHIELPRTGQTTIGFQRQFGTTMAVEVDYVHQGRFEKDVLDNMNLLFDPATGANLNFRSKQPPLPGLGRHLDERPHAVVLSRLGHGLHQGFSNRWQASATYSLSGFWTADSRPFSGHHIVPFPTAPDLGGEWGLSEDDQRHRATFSGIWQVGRGFQVSGSITWAPASGTRATTAATRTPARPSAAACGPMGRSCRAMRSSNRKM